METYKLSKNQLKRNENLERIFNIELSYNAYLNVVYNQKHVFVVGELFGQFLELDILILVYVFDNSGQSIQKEHIKFDSDKFEGLGSFKFHIPLTDNIDIENISILACPILEFMNHSIYRLGVLPVVGINIPDRKPFVKKISVGDEVELNAEPQNPYDKNAIRVTDNNGNMLGYVGKELALLLSKIIVDASSLCIKATVIKKQRGVLFIEINENVLEVIKIL